MKPPKCEECGEPLDTINIPEDDIPYYRWTGEKYVQAYEGTAHMACPNCGHDLTQQFEFSIPDEYDPEKYKDPFRDEHGIRRCCRYCAFFDENKYGEFGAMEEDAQGVCLIDSEPSSVFHMDTERSPNICNGWALESQIEKRLEELSIDPETGEILGC